jgi:hypothetical protein
LVEGSASCILSLASEGFGGPLTWKPISFYTFSSQSGVTGKNFSSQPFPCIFETEASGQIHGCQVQFRLPGLPTFPGKIRDKQGRRPNHPDYDARTVKVPDSVMAKLSGTQKEYWKTKQDYMDIVLFFKVGSFYELYELDAEIGIKEFGWKLTLSGVGKCRQVSIKILWIVGYWVCTFWLPLYFHFLVLNVQIYKQSDQRDCKF